MYHSAIVSAIFLLSSSCAIILQKNVSVDDFVNLINSKQSSWRAGRLSSINISTKTLTHLQNTGFVFHPPVYLDRKVCNLEGSKIPESFDARTQWPACKDFIGKIRHQGTCNSCWAFASTAVMSDRLCIQSDGKEKFEFSAQDLVSCCPDCDSSCQIGFVHRAWKFWVNEGIVSGGDVTSNRGCKPYQESEFYFSTRTSCNASCDNKDYNISYSEDKHYGSEYYIVNKTEQCIQKEIMEKGPVQVVFNAYEDFFYYKDGVYEYTIGGSKGAHTVKIIGWGTEKGIPYWLAANSWGCLWGSLDGFFKIRRGQNECGVEQFVIAGNPQLKFATLHSSHSNFVWLYVLIGVVFIIVVAALVGFNKKLRTQTINYLRLNTSS